MFYIKRTYGAIHDWLHAWDEKWGTSCVGSIAQAMEFPSRQDAEAACERANNTCRGYQGASMPEGMKFSVHSTIAQRHAVDKKVVLGLG